MDAKVIFELVSRIPRGRVATYKDLGLAMNSKAYRQIGRILSQNESPVLIPCHRVVMSDGSIGGYLGKMVDKKIELLEGEGVRIKDKRVVDFRDKYIDLSLISEGGKIGKAR